MSLAAYAAGSPRLAGRRKTFLGVDIGRHVDLTCLVLLEALEGLLWVRLVAEMKDTEYHRQMDAINEIIRRYRPAKVCTDATGMGRPLARPEGSQRRSKLCPARVLQ